MNDTEFIQKLLDFCEEASKRTAYAKGELTRVRGKDLLRSCVRLAHDMCKMYDMRPGDVDHRLVDSGFLK